MSGIQLSEEGWVVCRVFKKQLAAIRKFGEYDSPCWYDDQVSFLPEVDYPRQVSQPYDSSYRQQYLCKQELELHYSIMPPHHEALFPQLPQLESPNSVVPHVYERSSNAGSSFQASNLGEDQEHVLQMHRQSNNASIQGNSSEQAHDKVTDWRVLDKFVASQLMSHDDGNNPKDIMNYSNPTAYRVGDQMNCAGSKKPGGPEDLVGVPNSTCQIELWNCEEKPEYEVERYYKDLI
ncbi:hypothetical protein SAY87_031908 [Trapa incisa]|uniref:Uncharacterized protein n=1 Tax=Trapa incisa TaxID=236973 RepID=A0AAN7QM98_9MYRT|nr:hypothetical protein SAY87_031908 [Trapa incisa]